MADVFETFPYSNQHTLNLDWIIKIVDKLNTTYPGLIERLMVDFTALNKRVDELNDELDHYDETFIRRLVSEFIPVMVFPEISDAGYIVYNIPDRWSSIQFNTTGLDINLELAPEYGKLVLSY